MSEATVTRLRPRGGPGYNDTTALNDIHTLLFAAQDNDRDLVGDIAAILARTGRPMVRGRDIAAAVTESPIGWPVARVDAEDSTVIVRQDPAGPGLLVEITTSTPVEWGQLTVSLDGRRLHYPCPGRGDPA